MLPGENPIDYFQNLTRRTRIIGMVNQGRAIKCDVFATICLVILTCPASEAMVERAFSQIKAISTDFNKNMKPDLFLALSKIKLALRYKRKYDY